ncbi:hypothetical protein C8J57DRAFT_1395387 [Mycena rebaudengoi]|nr:hypothetical protein C8J57DRAFT_1395387 [Mycena rebaudengoi]
MADPFESTYGVAFITLFLATILYGIGLLQTFLYFHWYPKDRWTVKTTVVIVVILETMQIVFYLDALYFRLIDNFGKFPDLDIISWQDSAQLLFGHLSAFIVQMYFGYCISVLNPRAKIVSATIVLLGLVSLGSAIAQIIRTRQVGFYSSLKLEKPITVTTQSASTLACDIVITAALVYTLRGSKSDIKGTNTMLSALIVNAVNRGMLTAVSALINMTLFVVRPDTFYFFLGLVPSGKLYMNSMLATLNSREHVRSKAGNWESMSLGPFSSSRGEAAQPPEISRPNVAMGVMLTQESFTRGHHQADAIIKGGYIGD